MARILALASSYVAAGLRGATGLRVGALGPRPEKTLVVYEFEGCPFCRKVREALTALDLTVRILPCPKKGPRFRKELGERGGKQQFPYLVDPNTDAELYESDDIIRYLYARYGAGQPPLSLRLGPLTTLSSSLASASRGYAGSFYRPARAPELDLELYSMEGSPYCRLVREALCELELPYLLHNVGKGSPGRADFVSRSDRMMVPWLHDPNTGTSMFESADIVNYLNKTYAKG